jgi:hypothetical protein
VLACFTTAHARLQLYKILQSMLGWVLYFDTDSIIYQHDESQFNHIIMNSLGGWTDELSGYHITRYMFRCPKNCASETRGGKSVCKVKGLTLNYRASQIVSPATLENMLTGGEEVLVLHPHFFFTKHPPTRCPYHHSGEEIPAGLRQTTTSPRL